MEYQTRLASMTLIAGLGLAASPALAAPPDWIATSYFTAPAAAAPGAAFAGHLQFETTQMTVEADPADKLIQYPWAWWGIFDFLQAQDPKGAVPLFQLDATLFPGLAVDLVVSPDGAVIPAQRDLIRLPVAQRTASFWEVITGPGRSWQLTDGDHAGWSRAAFPISLVQSQEGEAWIGLASFDYKDGQTTPMKVQFSSDSAGGFIFWDPDFDVQAWAEVPFTVAASSADAAALTAGHAAETVGALPVAPLASLSPDLTAAAATLDPKATLAVAVLDNGTLYMDAVQTPFGPHPYPQDMRVGVWSASKSLIPGLAALAIAQKYGPDFLDTPIASYFKEGQEFTYPSAPAKERMDRVTIRNALNMQSGMGPDGYDANWDMKSTNTYQWSYSYALADQIRFYFNQEPNPNVSGPGEKMVYMDQDMWVAGLAMERFLKAKEGPDATLLGFLRQNVYDPIGARHFASGTGYTESGAPGVPFSGWGALPTVEILARAGALVAAGGKAPDGTQILAPNLVAGLSASEDYGLTFWRIKAGDKIVPKMSGAGGNAVMALPNGMVIVILSRDNYNYEIPDAATEALLAAAQKVRPF